MTQIGGATPSAATFDVTAANGFSYSITLPESVELSNGSEDITVDEFEHNAAGNTTGTGTIQTVGVGATLNVASGQATGNYTGTFNVSVAYE